MRVRGATTLKACSLSIAIAAAVGCSSQAPPPYCGPEIRLTVIGSPIAGAAGLQYGTVEVSIGELRGQATEQRIFIVAMGPAGSGGGPLKGHVTSVELVRPSGESLHQFPTTPGPGDQITITGTTPIGSIEAAQFRTAFIEGNLKLIIKTDLPEEPTLQLPLALKTMSDWNRAICS